MSIYGRYSTVYALFKFFTIYASLSLDTSRQKKLSFTANALSGDYLNDDIKNDLLVTRSCNSNYAKYEFLPVMLCDLFVVEEKLQVLVVNFLACLIIGCSTNDVEQLTPPRGTNFYESLRVLDESANGACCLLNFYDMYHVLTP